MGGGYRKQEVVISRTMTKWAWRGLNDGSKAGAPEMVEICVGEIEKE